MLRGALVLTLVGLLAASAAEAIRIRGTSGATTALFFNTASTAEGQNQLFGLEVASVLSPAELLDQEGELLPPTGSGGGGGTQIVSPGPASVNAPNLSAALLYSTLARTFVGPLPPTEEPPPVPEPTTALLLGAGLLGLAGFGSRRRR